MADLGASQRGAVNHSAAVTPTALFLQLHPPVPGTLLGSNSQRSGYRAGLREAPSSSAVAVHSLTHGDEIPLVLGQVCTNNEAFDPVWSCSRFLPVKGSFSSHSSRFWID